MPRGQTFAGVAAVLALVGGLAWLKAAGGGMALDRSALGVAGFAQLAPELGLTLQEPLRRGADDPELPPENRTMTEATI